jgi:hypothetical protein
VRDLIVRHLADPQATLVTGVIVDVAGHWFHVPASAVRSWPPDSDAAVWVVSTQPPCFLPPRQLHLAYSVLNLPVMTFPVGKRAPRITDVALRRTDAGWAVCAADTRKRWQRLLGRPRRTIAWSLLVERRMASTETCARTDPSSAIRAAADQAADEAAPVKTGAGRGNPYVDLPR